MKTIKIVLIGAASATFGCGAVSDILSSKELKEFDLEVVLVDIDKEALEGMLKIANFIKSYYKSNARIEATTDRTQALPGANYVILSVARKKWEMWEKEYYIPLAFGFRQIFAESGGPGVAFHTLRSLNLVMPIAKDIEKYCPNALIISYTNPESKLILGISKITKVRSVGLCHGVFLTLKRVSEVLEKKEEEIEIVVGGVNHFHWALKITDRATGKNLLPEFIRRVEKPDCKLDNLSRQLVKIFGYTSYPAASHPGEFVNFAYDIAGAQYIKWGLGKLARNPKAKATDLVYTREDNPKTYSYQLWAEKQGEMIKKVISGEKPLTKELAKSTDELAIPIICDIELDRNKIELAGNVVNSNSAISNLPSDAVVEVTIRVDANGVHPVKVGELPEAIAALCNLQISISKLLVEAYIKKSKKLLLQAIILDPVVDNLERAEEMMEVLLKAEAEYLPELK